MCYYFKETPIRLGWGNSTESWERKWFSGFWWMFHRVECLTRHYTTPVINKEPHDCPQYMYHKYGQDPDLKSREQEIDVQTEFMRQREHMEHTIASLKRQAHRNTSGKQDDISKMIDVSDFTLLMSMGWIWTWVSEKPSSQWADSCN